MPDSEALWMGRWDDQLRGIKNAIICLPLLSKVLVSLQDVALLNTSLLLEQEHDDPNPHLTPARMVGIT